MLLGNLKTRLLLFVAERLRSWANSIEWQVSQTQQKEDPPLAEEVNSEDLSQSTAGDVSAPGKTIPFRITPRFHGAPQHWIDLVREKAPELLDLPETQPLPRHSVEPQGDNFDEKVPRHESRQVSQDQENRRQKSETRKLRPSEAPFAGVPRKSKTKRFVRPKSFTIKPLKETTASVGSVEEISNRKPELNEDLVSSERSSPNPPTQQRAASLSQPVHGTGPTKPRNSERSTDLRTASSKPQRSEALNRQPANVKNALNKERGSQDGHLVTHPDQANHYTPSSTNSVSQQIERSRSGKSQNSPGSVKLPNVRLRSQEKPKRQNHINLEAAQLKAAARDQQKFIERGSALSEQKAAYAPSMVRDVRGALPVPSLFVSRPNVIRPAEPSTEAFQRSELNTPALINEETMSSAATVLFTALPSGENPWPDLPSPLEPDIAEEIAAHERELDRYRRLEREQRGTLWNE